MVTGGWPSCPLYSTTYWFLPMQNLRDWHNNKLYFANISNQNTEFENTVQIYSYLNKYLELTISFINREYLIYFSKHPNVFGNGDDEPPYAFRTSELHYTFEKGYFVEDVHHYYTCVHVCFQDGPCSITTSPLRLKAKPSDSEEDDTLGWLVHSIG